MLPLSLFAQLQDERHNLSVGINGGVNLNSVSFTPSIKQTNFIAPEFGLTVRYISREKSTFPSEDGRKLLKTEVTIPTTVP